MSKMVRAEEKRFNYFHTSTSRHRAFSSALSTEYVERSYFFLFLCSFCVNISKPSNRFLVRRESILARLQGIACESKWPALFSASTRNMSRTELQLLPFFKLKYGQCARGLKWRFGFHWEEIKSVIRRNKNSINSLISEKGHGNKTARSCLPSRWVQTRNSAVSVFSNHFVKNFFKISDCFSGTSNDTLRYHQEESGKSNVQKLIHIYIFLSLFFSLKERKNTVLFHLGDATAKQKLNCRSWEHMYLLCLPSLFLFSCTFFCQRYVASFSNHCGE